MMFHLYPRITTTDLATFHRSSIARLQYLLDSIEWGQDNYDPLIDIVQDVLEKNTEADAIGHFILQ